MCRTSPSKDIDDGGTDRRASCLPVSPAHFHSKVARWYSSRSSMAFRSGATFSASVRSTSGAIHSAVMTDEPTDPHPAGAGRGAEAVAGLAGGRACEAGW